MNNKYYLDFVTSLQSYRQTLFDCYCVLVLLRIGIKKGQVFIKSSELQLITGYYHPSLLQLHFTSLHLKHYALTFESNTYISPSPLLNPKQIPMLHFVAYRCVSLHLENYLL